MVARRGVDAHLADARSAIGIYLHDGHAAPKGERYDETIKEAVGSTLDVQLTIPFVATQTEIMDRLLCVTNDNDRMPRKTGIAHGHMEILKRSAG